MLGGVKLIYKSRPRVGWAVMVGGWWGGNGFNLAKSTKLARICDSPVRFSRRPSPWQQLILDAFCRPRLPFKVTHQPCYTGCVAYIKIETITNVIAPHFPMRYNNISDVSIATHNNVHFERTKDRKRKETLINEISPAESQSIAVISRY